MQQQHRHQHWWQLQPQRSSFYLEGPLELASSSWVLKLPGSGAGYELAFLHTRDVSGEFTHYHVVLFGAPLTGDDIHIADSTTETLVIEYIVYLG